LNEGRRLFIWFNCYGCHGGRAGGGMGPSLRDAEWRYGASDEAIFRSIGEGRQFGMPAWGSKLPAEQLWQLTAYIRSLGSPREPDPPPANPSLLKPPAAPAEQPARETGDAAG
jgi:cytochrome c oxidase cbb3-type subunit 3